MVIGFELDDTFINNMLVQYQHKKIGISIKNCKEVEDQWSVIIHVLASEVST